MHYSPEYAQQLRELHAGAWTSGGRRRIHKAVKYLRRLGGQSILDYGCGKGQFATQMAQEYPEIVVHEYDPGVSEKPQEARPADMVWCSHVLEHVEPACLEAVLDHIASLAPAAVLVIPNGPARETLPDGRNAHLIQEGADFWYPLLENRWYLVETVGIRPRHCMAFFCRHGQ